MTTEILPVQAATPTLSPDQERQQIEEVISQFLRSLPLAGYTFGILGTSPEEPSYDTITQQIVSCMMATHAQALEELRQFESFSHDSPPEESTPFETVIKNCRGDFFFRMTLDLQSSSSEYTQYADYDHDNPTTLLGFSPLPGEAAEKLDLFAHNLEWLGRKIDTILEGPALFEAMVHSIREDIAKARIGENSVEKDEDILPEDPRLVSLSRQYEALSKADRTYKGQLKTWEEIAGAIPNMPDFLSGVESLEQAQVYFLNKEGQLVVGDGCAEPPEETLGFNYYTARSQATRISYVNTDGRTVVVKGDATEILDGVQVLSERGLIDLKSEYKRVNNEEQFERKMSIWVESGKNPSRARNAGCHYGYMYSGEASPDAGHEDRGSRRVLRVNLNFES